MEIDITPALVWPAIVTFGALGLTIIVLLLLLAIPARHRAKINDTTVNIAKLFFCFVLIAVCLWFIKLN